MTVVAEPLPETATRHAPRDDYERLCRAVSDIDLPAALVDAGALERNAGRLLRRAGSLPIRIATKSLRVRGIIERLLHSTPRLRGVMAFNLDEALWLRASGIDDILMGYPVLEPGALARLARSRDERGPVLMVDCIEHVEAIAAVHEQGAPPIEVCLDLDVSWRVASGRIAIGPKRSPIHDVDSIAALTRRVDSSPAVRLVGVMGYEGHVAGVGDRTPGRSVRNRVVGALQPRWEEAAQRLRADAVALLRQTHELRIVNAGGTGSLHMHSAEADVTEVTAGSGFFAPALFDHYRSFRLEPAALVALRAVRRPGPGIVTCAMGGYIASGAPGRDRLPVVHLPRGLRLDPEEGAGEVQTPLRGAAAAAVRLGQPVFLRHAKAGELCERFRHVHMVRGDRVEEGLPTYRGEDRAFG